MYLILMSDILDECNNLETIHFCLDGKEDRTQWSSVINLVATPDPQEVTNSPGEKVRKIHSFHVHNDDHFNHNQFQYFLYRSKDLKHLTVSKRNSMDFDLEFEELFNDKDLEHIKILDISMTGSARDIDLENVLARCPEVEDVKLARNGEVTDQALLNLAESARNLKRLDITYCPQVTDDGIKEFITKTRSTLEKLVINNCQKIGPEVVRWAINTIGRRVIECKFDALAVPEFKI